MRVVREAETVVVGHSEIVGKPIAFYTMGISVGSSVAFIAGAALWGAGSAKSGQQQASKIRVVPTGTGMMAFGQF